MENLINKPVDQPSGAICYFLSQAHHSQLKTNQLGDLEDSSLEHHQHLLEMQKTESSVLMESLILKPGKKQIVHIIAIFIISAEFPECKHMKSDF